MSGRHLRVLGRCARTDKSCFDEATDVTDLIRMEVCTQHLPPTQAGKGAVNGKPKHRRESSPLGIVSLTVAAIVEQDDEPWGYPA